MKKHLRLSTIFPLALIVLLLGLAPASWADSDSADSDSADSDSGDSDSGTEIPFAVANVFFELNNTDGDLGIHALIDGDPWQTLSIETPDERENLDVRLRGSMRQQGLTEFFFESAEPTFDELAPETFFARFPEGDYEIEGTTIEGLEMESTAIITHLLPAPPEIEVNGEPVSEDCDEDPGPSVSDPITVSWEDVFLSHPDLGRTGELIDVDRYQLVIEQEDPPLKITIDLSPDVTSVDLPSGLLASGEQKVEVLVREESGNQTATESCFEVD